METRIYKIEPNKVAEIKKVLEKEDMFDVKAVCPKCGKTLEGLFNQFDISKYEEKEDRRGKVKPPEKTCECGEKFEFEKKILIANEFARNGYNLKSGESLGKPGASYLYIKADEDFFAKNEKILTDTGAEMITGDEAAEVEKKIDEEGESAAAGMGAIFG